MLFRSHGWDRDLTEVEQKHLRSSNRVSDFDAQYTFYLPGFNLRATDLQAFLGLRQIEKLDKIKLKRQENFNLYFDGIKDNKLSPVTYIHDLVSNFAYPVVNSNRAAIVQALRENEIEVRPLIAGSMARQPFWSQYYAPVKLPNCDLVHEQGFYLPNHPELTESEIESIIKIVNDNS